jgi:peptidoglycan hydrolase-like protein with peptidoglycan-binding domain
MITTLRLSRAAFIFTVIIISLSALVSTAHAQTSCTKLTYALSLGSSDRTTAGDVSKLQNFLKGKGYFSDAATGYYGPVTQKAVRAWQAKENFYEAAGAGAIGTQSRAKIAESCSQVTITQQSVKSKSNTFKLSGTAADVKNLFVALVHPYTSESTDWHTVYTSGSYVASTGDVVTKVKKGKWSVEFAGIQEGTYEARVYANDDGSQELLASQPLEVSAPDSFKFRAGSKKTVTLGVGQTATDGGVTITLSDVFLTNGLTGSSRASFIIESDGFNPGSYTGEVGEYLPGDGGGIVDEEAPHGSMRIKLKSISQSMNTATFIVEGGELKG